MFAWLQKEDQVEKTSSTLCLQHNMPQSLIVFCSILYARNTSARPEVRFYFGTFDGVAHHPKIGFIFFSFGILMCICTSYKLKFKKFLKILNIKNNRTQEFQGT